MFQINLPPFNTNIIETEGHLQIFDILRKRFVELTPEEWVRQHFIHYLTEHKNYPAALMGSEISLNINGMARRCDCVLFGPDNLPRMILEFKSPSVRISQAVFSQICAYNQAMHVRYLIISNGLRHFCCLVDYEHRKYDFLPEIPCYEELS